MYIWIWKSSVLYFIWKPYFHSTPYILMLYIASPPLPSVWPSTSPPTYLQTLLTLPSLRCSRRPLWEAGMDSSHPITSLDSLCRLLMRLDWFLNNIALLRSKFNVIYTSEQTERCWDLFPICFVNLSERVGPQTSLLFVVFIIHTLSLPNTVSSHLHCSDLIHI